MVIPFMFVTNLTIKREGKKKKRNDIVLLALNGHENGPYLMAICKMKYVGF
jgi:hypothetical protein